MNENIVTGKKYRILKDAASNIWDRISFWTKASDVELNSGITVESAINTINNTLTNGTTNPKWHADEDSTKYGKGTTTRFGHLKISNAYKTSDGSVSDGVAASSKAVNDVYSELQTYISSNNSAVNGKAPTPHNSTADTYGLGDGTRYGHVMLSSATNSGMGVSDGIAATPKAVYSVKSEVDAVNSSLTSNGKRFYFAYDSTSHKYGYKLDGSGTFYPFEDPDSYSIAVGLHSDQSQSDYVAKKTFTLPKGTYRFDAITKNQGTYSANIVLKYGSTEIRCNSGTSGEVIKFHYKQFTLSSDTSCTLQIEYPVSNLGQSFAIGYVYRV